LLSAFFCCLFVGTIKIGRAYNVAVFIQKVSPVVQHPHAPTGATLIHEAMQDHKILVGT
jgi:hypothetical protein